MPWAYFLVAEVRYGCLGVQQHLTGPPLLFLRAISRALQTPMSPASKTSFLKEILGPATPLPHPPGCCLAGTHLTTRSGLGVTPEPLSGLFQGQNLDVLPLAFLLSPR